MSFRVCQVLVYEVPVQQVIDHVAKILTSSVFIVDVVSVLPDIDAKNRHEASVDYRRLCVKTLNYIKAPVVIDGDPDPPATEEILALGDQPLSELFPRTVLSLDDVGDITGRLSSAFRGETSEKEGVVVDLRC